MATHIALYRGINVGGKNRVPMAELRQIFEEAGARDVETLIQSGNVVFEAPARKARAICDDVVAAVTLQLGVSAPLVLRSRAQFERASGVHPLGAADSAPKAFSVGFLSARPTKTQVAGLEPERFAPDVCLVEGSEVYLHYPGGIARSKLTVAYLDRVLGAVTTVRNWATVQKIAAVAASR
ncbi:MAG: DUF1697 domain-containing protein [Planctomycetota bacterium]